MTAPPVKDRIQSAKRSGPFDTDTRAKQRSRFTLHPDVEEEEDEDENENEHDELETMNIDPVATPITSTTTRQKAPFVKKTFFLLYRAKHDSNIFYFSLKLYLAQDAIS